MPSRLASLLLGLALVSCTVPEPDYGALRHKLGGSLGWKLLGDDFGEFSDQPAITAEYSNRFPAGWGLEAGVGGSSETQVVQGSSRTVSTDELYLGGRYTWALGERGFLQPFTSAGALRLNAEGSQFGEEMSLPVEGDADGYGPYLSVGFDYVFQPSKDMAYGYIGLSVRVHWVELNQEASDATLDGTAVQPALRAGFAF